jgi:hypothetical protein
MYLELIGLIFISDLEFEAILKRVTFVLKVTLFRNYKLYNHRWKY